MTGGGHRPGRPGLLRLALVLVWTGLVAAAPSPAAPTAPAGGTPAEVVRIAGGGGLDDAPPLASGAYEDALLEGETSYYRLDVDGPAAVTVDVAGLPGGDPRTLSWRVRLLDGTRTQLAEASRTAPASQDLSLDPLRSPSEPADPTYLAVEGDILSGVRSDEAHLVTISVSRQAAPPTPTPPSPSPSPPPSPSPSPSVTPPPVAADASPQASGPNLLVVGVAALLLGFVGGYLVTRWTEERR